jgi:hypothetical protein
MFYDESIVWKDDKLHGLFPYAPLTTRAKNEGAPKGDSRSLPGYAGPIPLATYHAYRVINPATDAAALDVEFTVPRAPSHLLRFVGPDGRTVRGVTVYGLLAPLLPIVVFDGGEVEALALDVAKPRELIALSNDGMHFAKTFVGAGDLPRGTIWLEPAGSVCGRLLDAATGRPLAGYRALFTDQLENNNHIPRLADLGTTVAGGRFTIRGLIPGLGGSIGFDLPFGTGPLYRPAALQNLVVRAGEARDLGDLRISTRMR